MNETVTKIASIKEDESKKLGVYGWTLGVIGILALTAVQACVIKSWDARGASTILTVFIITAVAKIVLYAGMALKASDAKSSDLTAVQYCLVALILVELFALELVVFSLDGKSLGDGFSTLSLLVLAVLQVVVVAVFYMRLRNKGRVNASILTGALVLAILAYASGLATLGKLF